MLEIEDINWEKIRKELDSQEWDEVEPGIFERQIFLGTVFALTPSGKYYVPFACGNVTEEQAEEDERWREKLEAEAEKRNLYVTNSDADPCDIMIGEQKNKENA